MHDLVDFVSEEAEIVGKSASNYILNGKENSETVSVKEGKNVLYVLPQKLNVNADNTKIFFRVTNTLKDVTIKAESGGEVIFSRKKKVAVPGEMETVLLTKEKISALKGEVVISAEVE